MTRAEKAEALRDRANWLRTAANKQERRYQDQAAANWYRAKAVEIERELTKLGERV